MIIERREIVDHPVHKPLYSAKPPAKIIWCAPKPKRKEKPKDLKYSESYRVDA